MATETLPPAQAQPVRRSAVIAWALWDWATQPYFTVILTFVWVPSFLTSDFFLQPGVAQQGINPDGTPVDCGLASNAGSAYCGGLGQLAEDLGWGITIAGLLIALLAPVIGQRADAFGRKKFVLGIFTGLLVLAEFGMVFVDGTPDMFWLGVGLVAAASVFNEIAAVSYNALIATVSTKRTVGRVSGLGWGFGYLGGILALVLVVVAILGGVLDGTEPQTFQIVAAGATVWTILFSIPLFLKVPEAPAPAGAKRVGFFAGYVELGRSVAGMWRDARNTFWFLVASAVYRDGLSSLFTFGAVIAAQVFGMEFTELVIFGVVLNLIAGISTIVAGRFDDRFGPKAVVLVSIGALMAITLFMFVAVGMGTPTIWIAGVALGVFVGPAQAASRSFLARLAPAGREGEIFGLYATTGRAAGWMGSALWALAISAAANQTIYGTLGITVLLAAGFVMLWFVKAPPRTLETAAA